MRLSRDHVVTAVAGALLVGLVLTGCGAADVRTRARETARKTLPINLGDALGCLDSVAPDLDRGDDKAALAEALSTCAGTTILNLDDGAILTADALSSHNGTLAISAQTTDGRELVLTLATSGAGLAEAGVSRARALLTTCWKVDVDLATNAVGEPTAATCSDAVITRINPSELVPLDDIDLPND